MSERTCAVCPKAFYCKGYCRIHYDRMRKTGTTDLMRPTPEDRFWAKVDRSGECWLWAGSRDPRGYGQLSIGTRVTRRLVPAHRFSYEMENGPIPEGIYIDHICHRPRCVRVSHLRQATPKQNQENRSVQGRGVSGVRGVTKNANGPSWSAQVGHHRTVYRLGSFPTIDDAKAAVIAKRNDLYTHNDADRRETRREQ